ncbi:MAG: hypothetical protein WC791_01745 [Candidatus Paceibacterota bacterium]|jgi:hypothetical protein
MKVFNIIKRYKLSLSIIFCTVLISGALVYKIKKSEALGYFGFGGYVTSVVICTCSAVPTYYVTIGPPLGGSFLLMEGVSEPYANWDIFGTNWTFVGTDTFIMEPAGPWVLGAYTPGVGVGCMMVGEPCYPYAPALGTIRPYGTSLGSVTGI